MKKGNRVILIGGTFAACQERPYQGTEFACAGVIKSISIGQFSKEEMAHVLWDNGCVVGVYTEYLTLCEDELKPTDPNRSFLLRKTRSMG